MTRALTTFCLALVICGTAAASAAAAPTAATSKADQITAESARLRGTVNPKGHPTTWYFEFGKTTNYGSKTANADAGNGTKARAVTVTLTGLKPLTTYHFRLVAFSTDGTTRTADRSFKTPQLPTTSTINVAPNPVVFGEPVLVTGNLSGPSVGGKQVALQGNAFPFTNPFTQLGNAVVTSDTGGYSFVIPGGVTSQLRVFYDSSPDVISPVATLTVNLKATLRVKASHRSPGVFSIAGGVAPSRIGNEVLIQRETSRGWRTVTSTKTKAGTGDHAVYKKRARIHKGGSFRALVKTQNGDYGDGESSRVRISVR
jgi:hypothetical protein